MPEPLARSGAQKRQPSLAAGTGDGCDGLRLPRKNLAAASASARRGFGVMTNGTRISGAIVRPDRNGARAIAASMKREPFGLVACERKEQIARFTARLSTASPLTTTAPLAGDRSVILKRSRSLMLFQSAPAPRI